MNYEKIGDFIKEKRKEKNLTQKELAEKLGVTDKAISKWERGLGCPDVSILEILSKELDCSILELLKGREIENEVIPITEADDYIKEGMKVSKDTLKNKITSIFNKGIILGILLIGLLLVYLNIVQTLYTSQEYEYRINREEYKKVSEKFEIIKKNMEMIEKNQGTYSKEDHEEIVERLKNSLKMIQSTKLYEYYQKREDIQYQINDIIVYAMMDETLSDEIEITRILEKYKNKELLESYRNAHTDSWLAGASNQDFIMSYMSYVYRLNPYEAEDIKTYKGDNAELRSISYRFKSDCSRLVLLTEFVKEVGEIHE